jgi:hypothetical protein
MTKEALPAEALGYGGASEDIVNDLGLKQKRLFQTDQSVETTLLTGSALQSYPCQYTDVKGDKYIVTYAQLQQLAKDNKITPTELNSSRSLLCVDHCAMSIPSKEMMDYVYRRDLFAQRNGMSLDFFGSYDIEAIRQKYAYLIEPAKSNDEQTIGSPTNDNLDE